MSKDARPLDNRPPLTEQQIRAAIIEEVLARAGEAGLAT
jgi:hypothetical protein